MSTQHDADRFLDFIRSSFLDTPSGAEGKSGIKMASKLAQDGTMVESAEPVEFGAHVWKDAEVVSKLELKSAAVSQILSFCMCVVWYGAAWNHVYGFK